MKNYILHHSYLSALATDKNEKLEPQLSNNTGNKLK
jgi:hypothetical protein